MKKLLYGGKYLKAEFGVFISILLLAASLIPQSCHRPFDNTENVLKVDTLQHLVNTIDQTLILDEDAFKVRNDSMVIKLNAIQQFNKDTTGETKSNIIRYNGIHKNYEDFLKNYPVLEFDCDKHKKIVADIKEKALSKKMGQAELDKTYIEEKAFLDDLLKKASTSSYNTYSIEEDYRRLDPVITKLYHQVAHN